MPANYIGDGFDGIKPDGAGADIIDIKTNDQEDRE